MKVFLPCSESINSFFLHRIIDDFIFLYILNSWRHVCDRKKKKTINAHDIDEERKIYKTNFFFFKINEDL